MTGHGPAPWHRLLAWAAAALAALAAVPASACTVATPPSTDIGSYSSAAVKGSAVPVKATSSSINCSTTVISLLSGNSFTATVTSANGFKLTTGNFPDQGSYQVYADAAGTKPFTSGVAMSYLNTSIIDVVGLLGSSPSAIPLYVKPSSTAALTPATYTGTFRVAWSWKFCSIAWVAGYCPLGKLDQGSGTADVTFTLKVAPVPLTADVASATTWDPISGTTFPKAITGSKRRLTITVSNPDIVSTDLNTVSIELPTPPGTVLALDGDGANGGTVINYSANGSSLQFSYTTPNDLADDVSFYTPANGWTYAPTPGDVVSQRAVTRVRFKPRGRMAAGSSFSISLPYLVE